MLFKLLRLVFNRTVLRNTIYSVFYFRSFYWREPIAQMWGTFSFRCEIKIVIYGKKSENVKNRQRRWMNHFRLYITHAQMNVLSFNVIANN